MTGLVFGLIDQIIGANAEILRSSGQGASWMVPMLGLARGVIAAVAMAVFSAAVYRAVLRPEGKAWGRMRFGADEIRLTLVWLLHGLLLLVVTIVAIVPALALSTLMAKQSPAITGVMGTIVAVGVLVAWIALIARLSLVAPMALAEGRWGGPAAWRLTQGHAWKILAVHLPVLLGLALLFSLSRTLYSLAAMATHADFSASMLRTSGSLAEVFAPVRLAYTILTAALGAAAAAILYAPAAFIYRDLKGVMPADQAAVFD